MVFQAFFEGGLRPVKLYFGLGSKGSNSVGSQPEVVGHGIVVRARFGFVAWHRSGSRQFGKLLICSLHAD
jgi:hypothetical protein